MDKKIINDIENLIKNNFNIQGKDRCNEREMFSMEEKVVHTYNIENKYFIKFSYYHTYKIIFDEIAICDLKNNKKIKFDINDYETIDIKEIEQFLLWAREFIKDIMGLGNR